jgi:hypothetical protein
MSLLSICLLGRSVPIPPKISFPAVIPEMSGNFQSIGPEAGDDYVMGVVLVCAPSPLLTCRLSNVVGMPSSALVESDVKEEIGTSRRGMADLSARMHRVGPYVKQTDVTCAFGNSTVCCFTSAAEPGHRYECLPMGELPSAAAHQQINQRETIPLIPR